MWSEVHYQVKKILYKIYKRENKKAPAKREIYTQYTAPSTVICFASILEQYRNLTGVEELINFWVPKAPAAQIKGILFSGAKPNPITPKIIKSVIIPTIIRIIGPVLGLCAEYTHRPKICGPV